MKTEPPSDLPKLSAPARRALTRAGYSTLEQLTQAKESDLAKLHGMGPKAIHAPRDSLHQRGLSFKT
jgi:DNA-directed RNA polymerase alpha subunit